MPYMLEKIVNRSFDGFEEREDPLCESNVTILKIWPHPTHACDMRVVGARFLGKSFIES